MWHDTSNQLTSPGNMPLEHEPKQVHHKTVIFSLTKPKKNEQYFSQSKRTLVILTFAQTPSYSSLPVFVWSAILDHVCNLVPRVLSLPTSRKEGRERTLGTRLSCLVPAFRHSAVSPWLQFSNKMAGDSSGEVKQVLLATEAELYIEELKTYPLKEIGSPK